MKNAAAFKASYADWKLIKTRNAIQIVFEVPLEDHDKAYQALGGMPDQSTARWFAIARLTDGASAHAPREAVSDSGQSERPASRSRSLAQQAGICCGNPLFQNFLEEVCHCDMNETIASEFVRHHCKVSSRSEIRPGTTAADRWRDLHSQFLIWRDNPDLVPDQHERMDQQGEVVR